MDGDVTAAALARVLPVVEREFELMECCHRASVHVHTCTCIHVNQSQRQAVMQNAIAKASQFTQCAYA